MMRLNTASSTVQKEALLLKARIDVTLFASRGAFNIGANFMGHNLRK